MDQTNEEDLRKRLETYFFTERVVLSWNRPPAEVVIQQTVSGFKHT